MTPPLPSKFQQSMTPPPPNSSKISRSCLGVPRVHVQHKVPVRCIGEKTHCCVFHASRRGRRKEALQALLQDPFIGGVHPPVHSISQGHLTCVCVHVCVCARARACVFGGGRRSDVWGRVCKAARLTCRKWLYRPILRPRPCASGGKPYQYAPATASSIRNAGSARRAGRWGAATSNQPTTWRSTRSKSCEPSLNAHTR
jgi:hypothetical protein